MSGPYGRQEVHESPGASPELYLQLLDQRRSSQAGDGLLKCSDFRWRLLSAMAARADEEWTAESLAYALRSGNGDDDAETFRASVKAVHSAMTELMGDQWAEPVPFQHLLTVRLTTAGKTQVQRLREVWRDDAKAGGSDA
jgi:hypothetical protein